MTSQPPMFDPIGPSLPGPQFTSRPGWGGQLRRWYVDNVYSIIFQLVMLCALVLLGMAFVLHREQSPSTSSGQATATPDFSKSITLTALRGDGMTNLAARALDLYSAVQKENVPLDAAQHLFAVDTLTRSVCWCPVETDAAVQFSSTNISSVITRAQHLSPTQKAAWSRLLR